MSTNPTYWSIQKTCVSLTLQANWLRASGLDLKDVQNRYYEAASKIAQGDPTVGAILDQLEGLWPANFKPVNLHYDGNPFHDTIMFSKEDATVCAKMAKPKGLKVPESFFLENVNDSATELSEVMVRE